MTYLSTRLTGLDDQISQIFNDQQHQEAVQNALSALKKALPKAQDGNLTSDQMTNIKNAAADLIAVDPELGQQVAIDLNKQGGGMIFDFDTNNPLQPGLTTGQQTDTPFTAAEVTATSNYIDDRVKDNNSSSEMNMIKLQSLMSSRQTAVQLSTNLIAALGDTTKSIVTNVGR
jgi:hypothetical protein